MSDVRHWPSPTDLSHHGLTTGAIHKLGAVFEIAKRYGEREWGAGEPLRGPKHVIKRGSTPVLSVEETAPSSA